MKYQPKQPKVVLSVRVEPRIKEWLEINFPENVGHGVNHILAEYMAKHTKGANHASDLDQTKPLTKEQLNFQRWAD